MTIIKDKILTEDIRHWDGIERSSSRRDSQGGTIIGKRHGHYVDVLTVYGQSFGMTDETISSALAAVGSRVVAFSFTPGTWVINSNLTIPSTVVSLVPAGVYFQVESGVTLTFNGPVINEYSTWSTGSGTVTVSGSWTLAGLTLSTPLGYASGGTNAATAAAAFSNLKQAATTSATGVVELATAAETITGTDTGRVVTPDGLGEAMGVFLTQSDSATAFTFHSAVTESAWETVGPTSSGMTNIWSALDDIPTDADWIRVRVYMIGSESSGTVHATRTLNVYTRAQGGASSADASHTILAIAVMNDSAGYSAAANTVESTIRLNPSNRSFEIYWSGSLTPSDSSLVLVGYGYNGG